MTNSEHVIKVGDTVKAVKDITLTNRHVIYQGDDLEVKEILDCGKVNEPEYILYQKKHDLRIQVIQSFFEIKSKAEEIL